MTHSHSKPYQSWTLLTGLVCLGLMVSGCTRPQGIFPNTLDDDVRERHLVKQQTKIQTLSILPIGPKHDQISQNDLERITSFVGEYKESGLDSLKVTYAGSQAVQPALTALLNKLGESKTVSTNGKARLGMAEVVLSYTAIEAVLDRDCQGRHTDGGMTFMVPNKSIGCAYTLAFAKQINDPRELSEPRALEKKFVKSIGSSNGSKTSSESQSSDSSGKGVDSLISAIK